MYASRTDKAHSQNGGYWERMRNRLDDFWADPIVYNRASVKNETREIVADEMLPVRSYATAFPGLKRIAQAQVDRREAERNARFWADIEAERIANLDRVVSAYSATHQRVDYRDGVSALVPLQGQRMFIEHHVPKGQPVTRYANLDHDTPSLMQIAAARAKSLGINK